MRFNIACVVIIIAFVSPGRSQGTTYKNLLTETTISLSGSSLYSTAMLLRITADYYASGEFKKASAISTLSINIKLTTATKNQLLELLDPELYLGDDALFLVQLMNICTMHITAATALIDFIDTGKEEYARKYYEYLNYGDDMLDKLLGS